MSEEHLRSHLQLGELNQRASGLLQKTTGAQPPDLRHLALARRLSVTTALAAVGFLIGAVLLVSFLASGALPWLIGTVLVLATAGVIVLGLHAGGHGWFVPIPVLVLAVAWALTASAGSWASAGAWALAALAVACRGGGGHPCGPCHRLSSRPSHPRRQSSPRRCQRHNVEPSGADRHSEGQQRDLDRAVPERPTACRRTHPCRESGGCSAAGLVRSWGRPGARSLGLNKTRKGGAVTALIVAIVAVVVVLLILVPTLSIKVVVSTSGSSCSAWAVPVGHVVRVDPDQPGDRPDLVGGPARAVPGDPAPDGYHPGRPAVAIDFIIFYKVLDPLTSVLAVQDFKGAATNIASTTLRSVVGDMSLDDVLSKREQMNDVLRIKLDDVTERWGVKVTNVEVREIKPPPAVLEAMTRQMGAERGRRAAVPRGRRPEAGLDHGRRRSETIIDPPGRGSASKPRTSARVSSAALRRILKSPPT